MVTAHYREWDFVLKSNGKLLFKLSSGSYFSISIYFINFHACREFDATFSRDILRSAPLPLPSLYLRFTRIILIPLSWFASILIVERRMIRSKVEMQIYFLSRSRDEPRRSLPGVNRSRYIRLDRTLHSSYIPLIFPRPLLDIFDSIRSIERDIRKKCTRNKLVFLKFFYR